MKFRYRIQSFIYKYLYPLQSDTEDDEIVITKVVLNETTKNKSISTPNKIESTQDIDLSIDEDDENGAWFDDSFRLYLSEVRNC